MVTTLSKTPSGSYLGVFTSQPIDTLVDFYNNAQGNGTPGPLTASFFVSTSATAITAGTTHSLAGATPLTAAINYITVVANASDAVALPSAASVGIGGSVIIFNEGAHAAAVWPQAADAVDGGSAGAAVTLTNAKRCEYFVQAANTWTSAQLGVASA